MKKHAKKLVWRIKPCFDCDGRGEKANFVGRQSENDSGYQHGPCASCEGRGYKRKQYEQCACCGHEQLYFSPAQRALLERLASK